MLKRLMALGTAAVLLLSMAACTGGDNTSSFIDVNSTEASSQTSESSIGDGDPGTDIESSGDSSEASQQNVSSSKDTAGNSSSGGSTNAEEGTISWWTTNPGAQAAPILDKAIQEFQKKTGYTVKLSIQSSTGGSITEFDAKFVPALKAGKGPDVCSLRYIDPQYAIELTNEYDAAFWNQFFPSVKDSIKLNGKYYSVPSSMSVNGLLSYSKVDFKNAGFDPNQPPKTIADLDRMAEKMYKPSADGYSQVGFCSWSWIFFEFPSLLFKPFGGSLTNAEGYPTANSKENVAALEWMMSYVTKYGKEKVDKSLSKLVNDNNSYGHGVAMVPTFSAGLNSMAANNQTTKEFGITVFPGVNNKTNGLSIGLASGFSIMKDCKNKSAAKEFIKYLSSDYQINYYMKNYKSQGAYSANKTAWEKNLDIMDSVTKMMYTDILVKTQAKDIDSVVKAQKYSAPSNYTTQMTISMKKILNGEAEIKAELDALQKRVVSQTKTN